MEAIDTAYALTHGDLAGAYSRRINIQHRLVYQVLEAENAVKILGLWTHYEEPRQDGLLYRSI
ncbi:MAG: hypothetical protein GYB33_00720 [Gammaproteobacteria bacterium]|nr:hypothetical protein [Gammaproteobacteria bacterium]